ATALGFIAAGFTGGYLALLGCLLVAGLGSGVQHPLSSTLVSNVYDAGGRRTALGTYNFSGDLGKGAVPASVAFGVPCLRAGGAAPSEATRLSASWRRRSCSSLSPISASATRRSRWTRPTASRARSGASAMCAASRPCPLSK